MIVWQSTLSFGSAVEDFEIIKSERVCDSRTEKKLTVFFSFLVFLSRSLCPTIYGHEVLLTLPVLTITETFIMVYWRKLVIHTAFWADFYF